ncbi:hypothetical protein Tco_0120941 [Tanacetum coccineum]
MVGLRSPAGDQKNEEETTMVDVTNIVPPVNVDDEEDDGSRYQFRFSLGTKELTMNVENFRRIFQLPQATDNNHVGFVDQTTFGQMVQFFCHNLGFTLSLRNPSNLKSKGLPQPWQTLCKIFAHFFTTRAAGHYQLPIQVMQMLYCFINNVHVDCAKVL